MTGARAVVAAALVVLGVSACSGDDPEPRLAPSESSSPTAPSTSPASGTTAPRMPAEAAGTDAAAAEAFVRFYWEMASYAQATGDIHALRDLSSEACEACRAGIDAIASVYQRGGLLRGGGTVVQTVSSSGIAGGDRTAVQVTARITNERQELDLPGSKEDRTFPTSTVMNEFIVELIDGHWLMSYWASKS